MLKQERQNYILDEIRTNNRVLSSELSQKLMVSEDTIRRDLKELSDNGQIKKVHGGAMASSYIPFSHKDREIYAHEEKMTIVRKALSLIQDESLLVLDGGTTNLALARLFPPDLKATVFTNSLPIALQLSEHPKIETVIVGGRILKNAQVSIGVEVIQCMAEVHADICFIGTRSIHPDFGITDFDREESQAKQALLSSARQVVSLSISEKINTVQPYKVADPAQIHTLVTELDPQDKLFNSFKQQGIVVV